MSVHEILLRLISQLKSGVHPSDLLELIEGLDDDQQKKQLLELLSDDEAARIIQEMEEFDQVALFRLLGKDKASAILSEMDSDDAVDLLGELSPQEASELLQMVEGEGEEFQDLLKHPEDSAGGIMTTDFISLPGDLPVEEALLRLREIAPQAETIYYVYVVDEESRLVGVLSLRDLIAASDGTPLKEIMRRNVISVNVLTDQEEVARVVAKYDLLAIPVVDLHQKLLGIVTVDDVLDVIEAEATEDIYKLGGTSEVKGVELLEAPALRVVWRRLPWLLVCLAGGFLSGSVIGAFESTLEAILVLAVFIPVIMDMGGNVGTQTSTIFVRGIATGEINRGGYWRYFFREVQIGLSMGVLLGAFISLAAYLWQGSVVLGVVVGVSMVATVIVAAIIGTLVPMVCSLLKIDPAITAGPFVTTIKDVTGLLIYFNIATMFLKYLR